MERYDDIRQSIEKCDAPITFDAVTVDKATALAQVDLAERWGVGLVAEVCRYGEVDVRKRDG